MNKNLKVVLNMSKLTVPQKITQSRFVVDSISNNSALFPSPIPTLPSVVDAINALENAWNDAADGGKHKTAMMHEKETDLMKIMFDVAHYVERVANGDSEVVVASGLYVKKQGQTHFADFTVEHTEHPGEVYLRVKPQYKTVYRWEYSKDTLGSHPWVAGVTTITASANIQDLEEATKYWFRVVFIGKGGETIQYNPICLIVC